MMNRLLKQYDLYFLIMTNIDGYDYSFVKNISSDPGSHKFNGIKNPHLCKEIESWGADAVLVFGWNFHSHLLCMRYFYGKIPVLFRGDSTLIDEGSNSFIKKFTRKLVLRFVYSYVDHFLYVGKENKNYFIKFGVSESQLTFVPHAVDNQRFASTKDEGIRNKLGVKKNDVLFLFAGKFEEKKNPILLINAFVSLNMSDSHLLMVGNGKLEDEMKRKIGRAHV